MDPEKPKSDSASEPASDRPSAEQRVERLSRRERERENEVKTDAAKGREANAGGPDSGSAKSPPRLTERQRKEAREQRRRGGRSRSRKSSGAGSTRTGSRDGSGTGNPLSRGIRATLLELRRTARFFGALILTGLDRLGPAIRWLTAGMLELLSAAGTALSGFGRLLAKVASRLGHALVALDRHLAPRRALIVVVGAGVATLVASQFLDFRATEVGRAAYGPIQELTRAPRIDVRTPMDSHSIMLLAVGAMALAGLIGAAITGRRAFGGLIALAGAATIAVTLLIDLPKGLDIAIAEISYSEVAAVLLSGFWAQLAAGFVLATGGLGLLALSGQRSRSRSRTGDPEPGSGSGRDRQESRPGGNRRESASHGHGARPLDAGGMS